MGRNLFPQTKYPQKCKITYFQAKGANDNMIHQLIIKNFSSLSDKIEFLKVPMHRNFDNVLLANMKDRWKPKIRLFTVC